jgi:hypothetical protein
MRRSVLPLVAVAAAFAVTGCVVAPVAPYRGPPPRAVYVEPVYPSPGPGWGWRQRPGHGWGWYHRDRGWRDGR